MALMTGLDSSAIASATAVTIQQKNQKNAATKRPEKIVCIGQAQSGKTVEYNKPILALGNSDDIGVIFGFGSPLHRMAKKLFPKSGNGSKVDTYFMAVPDVNNAVATVKTVTAEGKASKTFNGYIRFRDLPFEAAADVAGKVATIYQKNPTVDPRKTDLNIYETTYIPFSIPKDTTATQAVALLKDELDEQISLPAVATVKNSVLTLTAKWAGADSDFFFDIVNDEDEEITTAEYGIKFTGATDEAGAGVGKITEDALDMLDEDFGVTRVVSQYSDELTLNQLNEKFVAFHDALIAQYVLCYTSVEAPVASNLPNTYDVSSLITLGTRRRDDNVNVYIVGDYGNLKKLKYSVRNKLLKSGISNLVKKADGSYRLMDLCTFYHPIGKENPIFKFDRDITVIANCIYNIRDPFENGEEWKSIVLVADDDITVNPAAKKLKDVKAEVNKQIGLLGRDGYIANYKEAMKHTKVEIDPTNPNRVNINPDWDISGVGRIFDIVNAVGFYFG